MLENYSAADVQAMISHINAAITPLSCRDFYHWFSFPKLLETMTFAPLSLLMCKMQNERSRFR
jgi:hypothetical protein